MPEQIPLKVRSAYVAMLRLWMAIEQLDHIPRGAPRPPGADAAVRTIKQWHAGLGDKLKPYIESPDDVE